MLKPKPKCPHCENTDPKFIETNGDTEYLTYLCIAPCAEGETSFGPNLALVDVEDDALRTQCGMQWDAIEQESIWECHDCGEEYGVTQHDVERDAIECKHCDSRNVAFLLDA
jgi:DNA-directed RNA polymerase subunit RPC12/RpoP